MSELRFDGLSVIVTGAGRGFGRCHAKLLASRGAKVVVADNGCNPDGSGFSREPAQQVVKEIEAEGGEAVACFESVAEESGAATIVATALDSFGRLDVLVNNAGIVDPHWFADLTEEQFRRMVEVHYLGTVYVTKAAWPHLEAAPHGAVVNTASEGIVGHIPKCVSYAGAKGGVFAFTRALALDGRRLGLRVNAVAPRGTTRMSDPQALGQVYDVPPETFDNPFMNNLKPEFVSPGVAYLAHESCTLNGEILVCGGGQANRLTLIKSKGATFENITPEDIASSIDEIMDMTDAKIQTIDTME
jgi:NAD(P)-dependent dehydrogenase (short-subunit alcohol dehydrogenase family)